MQQRYADDGDYNTDTTVVVDDVFDLTASTYGKRRLDCRTAGQIKSTTLSILVYSGSTQKLQSPVVPEKYLLTTTTAVRSKR